MDFTIHFFARYGKAVKRINKAIEKKEKITIYGDYDVDGITSITLLKTFFKF